MTFFEGMLLYLLPTSLVFTLLLPRWKRMSRDPVLHTPGWHYAHLVLISLFWWVVIGLIVHSLFRSTKAHP